MQSELGYRKGKPKNILRPWSISNKIVVQTIFFFGQIIIFAKIHIFLKTKVEFIYCQLPGISNYRCQICSYTPVKTGNILSTCLYFPSLPYIFPLVLPPLTSKNVKFWKKNMAKRKEKQNIYLRCLETPIFRI